MKAAIVNPYLDTLGGGERYSLTFAKTLSELGFKVDFEWEDKSIKDILVKRFGIELDDISFIPEVKRGDGYDVCFWVSDGSIPTLKARKNILHFQTPFYDVGGKSLLNKMKLFRINNIICNSQFTKNIIDQEYGVVSDVIHPPVSLPKKTTSRKKDVIVYVGRFSQLVQSKNQDVLVSAYKKLIQNTKLKNFKLILAGGNEVGSYSFIEKLKNLSQGFNIEIIENPSYQNLCDIYYNARFFWNASGMGEDLKKNPERAEHFGITTVEAMSFGAIPLSFNGGGQPEIVKNGFNGYLWEKTSQLINLTIELFGNKSEMAKMSQNCITDARKYGYEEFKNKVKKLL